MRILIEGGRVIDPANQQDGIRDVWIEDGRIAAVQAPGAGGERGGADRVFDARGKVVCPGFVDLHVHLNTVEKPLNALDESELIPGSAALEKFNASLR